MDVSAMHALATSNKPPSRSDAAHIALLLAETESAIARLTPHDAPLSVTQRTAYKCILSPIRRVPPEILSYIFLFTLPPHNPCFPPEQITTTITESPLNVQLTCRNWNITVNATPHFWLHRLVYGPSIQKRSLQRIERELTRTGSLPIRLSISIATRQHSYGSTLHTPIDITRGAVLPLLLPIFDRTTHLSLSGLPITAELFTSFHPPPPAYLLPHLTTLHLVLSSDSIPARNPLHPWTLFKNAPKITTLHLSHVLPDLPPLAAFLNFPWESLTTLSLTPILLDPADLLALLRLTTALESLTYHLLWRVDRHPIEYPETVLPALVHLTVHIDEIAHHSFPNVLRALHTPALSTLTINARYHYGYTRAMRKPIYAVDIPAFVRGYALRSVVLVGVELFGATPASDVGLLLQECGELTELVLVDAVRRECVGEVVEVVLGRLGDAMVLERITVDMRATPMGLGEVIVVLERIGGFVESRAPADEVSFSMEFNVRMTAVRPRKRRRMKKRVVILEEENDVVKMHEEEEYEEDTVANEKEDTDAEDEQQKTTDEEGETQRTQDAEQRRQAEEEQRKQDEEEERKRKEEEEEQHKREEEEHAQREDEADEFERNQREQIVGLLERIKARGGKGVVAEVVLPAREEREGKGAGHGDV